MKAKNKIAETRNRLSNLNNKNKTKFKIKKPAGIFQEILKNELIKIPQTKARQNKKNSFPLGIFKDFIPHYFVFNLIKRPK